MSCSRSDGGMGLGLDDLALLRAGDQSWSVYGISRRNRRVLSGLDVLLHSIGQNETGTFRGSRGGQHLFDVAIMRWIERLELRRGAHRPFGEVGTQGATER